MTGLEGMYRSLLKKLRFVAAQNDQVMEEAKAAHLHRIYYTAAITAPVHLFIALIPKYAVGIYAVFYVLYCYGMGIASSSPAFKNVRLSASRGS